jgi:hypothetical protein
LGAQNSTGSDGDGRGVIGQYAVRADQQLPGTGTLLLANVDVAGNTAGTTTGSNVTVTVAP